MSSSNFFGRPVSFARSRLLSSFPQPYLIHLSQIDQGHFLEDLNPIFCNFDITEKYWATCPALFFSIRRPLYLQVESPSSSDKVYRH
jgi:hypothetical protein